ncbi:MAG: sigma-E factor negative regulatory protein [Betaproteobacteria bacterium]
MEKISQLMDGELEGQEFAPEIRKLGKDAALAQTWDAYHLIRDVLRNEGNGTFSLAQRVHETLKAEPTIIAPHTRMIARATRLALPMAAAVAGVTVVGWLALSSLNGTTSVAPRLAAATAPVLATAPRVLASDSGTDARPMMISTQPMTAELTAPTDGMDEYLIAHQEFSPGTPAQGGSYLSAAPGGEAGAAR